MRYINLRLTYLLTLDKISNVSSNSRINLKAACNSLDADD